MINLFLGFLLFFSLLSCSGANEKIGQKDDWIGEELAEEAIKYETGLDVDLTPQSSEK